MYNLQTLLLSNCYDLSELPENIGDLINLRHLDVSNTNLRMMPPRFGRLKNLLVVTDFVVSKDLHSSKISELGQLSHLRTLSITKLENVAYFKHALEANLKNKKYLNELFVKLTTTTTTTHHQVKNKNVHVHLQTHQKQYENVLINPQPHENLKKLMIENYDGTTFPNWLGDAIFSNMVSLRLSKCKYCESLPSLGQLSSLQELYIVEMERLQLLHSGFSRDGQFGIKPFRSLKILSFIKLPRWSVWTHDGEDIPFPSLQEFQIRDCPQLIESLPKKLYSLKKLELSDCPKLLPFSEDIFPSKLQSVVITNCNNLTPQKQWGLHGMKSLTCFKIEGGCSEAELFPEE